MKNYDYIKKVTPNTQVKYVADQFYEASQFLWEKELDSEVLIPAIVNSVLSLELFLKSLISYAVIKDYTKDKNGVGGGIVTAETDKQIHKLSLLFDEIDGKVSDELNNEFSKIDIAENYQSLRECLAKYDSTFVKVRYLYEDSTKFSKTNISELKKLAIFLYNYVSNMNQTSKIIK